MITNACEPGVNNSAIDRLATIWEQCDGVNLRCYAFEKEMCLPHDLMTPGTPGVPTKEVYDRLIDQVQQLHEARPAE